MLIDEIRSKFNQARKEQDHIAKNAYESVLAKITNAEKSGKYINLPLEDNVAIGLIQKEIKELEETKSFYKESDAAYTELTTKIELLSKYLPPALTDDEITVTIQRLIETVGTNKGKLIGTTIKELEKTGKSFDKSKIGYFVDICLQRQEANE